jgi:hypothetical protein
MDRRVPGLDRGRPAATRDRAVARSRREGNHPFAAIVVDADGTLLAQAFNGSAADRTGHAEMNALRAASAAFPLGRLARATLYTSAEPAPCARALPAGPASPGSCALSETRLLSITGSHPGNPTLALPCREVFARGQRALEVIGPLLEDEAAAVHEGSGADFVDANSYEMDVTRLAAAYAAGALTPSTVVQTCTPRSRCRSESIWIYVLPQAIAARARALGAARGGACFPSMACRSR